MFVSLLFRECLVLEDLGQKRLEVTQCHVLEAGLHSFMQRVNFWSKTISASFFRCLSIFINILAATKWYFCFISEFVEEISGKGCATFEFFKRYAMLTMTWSDKGRMRNLLLEKRLVLSILVTLSILNILSIFSILTAGMAGALDMFRKKGGGEADQVRIST